MNSKRKIDKIIFLVGGLGTRLGDEGKYKPKPLVEVGRKTLLDYSVLALEDVRFSEAIFVAGYLSGQIKDYIARYKFQKSLIVLPPEDVAKGTAYGFWTTRDLIKPQESVLLVLPDSVWKFKNFDFLDKEDENTIFCMKSKDIHLYGEVEIDENHMITELRLKPETPSSSLADAGIYFFRKSKDIFEYLEKDYLEKNISGREADKPGRVYLTTTMGEMIKDKHKFRERELEYWYDCGTLDGLNSARSLLRNNPEIFNF